jgi:shikimate kinase
MNLYLIGYRGSGKTVVGSKLAKRLDLPHYDSDDLVEQQSGQTIQQIFAMSGEVEFRRLESEVIRSLHRLQPAVVSLGGGAILAPENRDQLKSSGRLVWLKAAAEVLYARIANDPTSAQRRPQLTAMGGWEEVETVLRQREPIYSACADFTVEVGELSPVEVTETIFHWWVAVDTGNIPNE